MNLEILDKSYDIRWIYPIEVNEDFYYKIWVAYAALLVDCNTFAIWYDARLSWESLKNALISWILSSWKKVIDIWLCSTDMIYFSSWKYSEIDVGIMITASHNPKEYNWIKSCLKNAVPINMKEFGKEIKRFILENNDLEYISSQENNFSNPNYLYRNISDDFVEHIASFIINKPNKKYRIVADAGSWVAGVFMNKLASRLDFELIPMFFEPDGNFPYHHPSPIEPENVADLIAKVKEINADIWVAFDGDADRMYICDEEGVIWSWTITTAMISQMILEKNIGKKVAYNAVCGNIVPEVIKNSWWVGIITKVGHVYIKEIMKNDEDIVFGWEHSGHYYFRNNWNADSWVIAFAVVLDLIYSTNNKPSELRKKFEKYVSIPETNSIVSSVQDKLDELKEIYSFWDISELDWLTIRFDNFWFNVRPSSNEPLLRLNMEAINWEILEEKSKEVLEIIRR